MHGLGFIIGMAFSSLIFSIIAFFLENKNKRKINTIIVNKKTGEIVETNSEFVKSLLSQTKLNEDFFIYQRRGKAFNQKLTLIDLHEL